MNKSWFILFFAGMTLIQSCAGSFGETVKAETSKYISAGELNYMIQNKESVLILDIREPSKYRMSHIPKAINLPYYEIDTITNRFNTLVKVVIYDQQLMHAKYILKKIRYMGYEESFMLNGGYNSWIYEKATE